ncbi:hypothetical protein QZH41_004710 [Actinostola sp. cb2023]|nr:hypothetical protein QZH41_004710 [Actinostola sp. cb2023]
MNNGLVFAAQLFDARRKLIDNSNVTFKTTEPCVCATSCGCSCFKQGFKCVERKIKGSSKEKPKDSGVDLGFFPKLWNGIKNIFNKIKSLWDLMAEMQTLVLLVASLLSLGGVKAFLGMRKVAISRFGMGAVGQKRVRKRNQAGQIVVMEYNEAGDGVDPRTVITVSSRCHHGVITVSSRCHHGVITVSSRCHHNAITVSSQCNHGVITVSSQCNHGVITVWDGCSGTEKSKKVRQCNHGVITMQSRCHHGVITVSSRCHHGVITMQSRCHHSAITVSSRCHHSVITVSSRCHHGVSRCHGVITMQSRCHHGVITVSSRCHHNAITVSSRCHHNAITVSSQCNHGVITVSSQCNHGVITVSSRCHHGVITVSSRCHHGVITVCHHGVITVSSRCHHGVITVSSQCNHGVITVSSRCHHGVITVSSRCHHNAITVSSQCNHGVITVSSRNQVVEPRNKTLEIVFNVFFFFILPFLLIHYLVRYIRQRLYPPSMDEEEEESEGSTLRQKSLVDNDFVSIDYTKEYLQLYKQGRSRNPAASNQETMPTMSMCNLLAHSIISLLNVIVFGLFVSTQYFLDQDDKFFFKWILGNRTSSYISSRYNVSISLSWWVKYLWYAVYVWQGLWMAFAVALLFKKKFPDGMNCLFFLLFISSIGFDIAWVIFKSRDAILPACIVIFCSVLLKALALILAYVKFEDKYDYEEHTLGDFWGFHLLTCNGIAGLVVVSTYNALIWLSIVLTYKDEISEQSSTTIALTIAYTIVIIWFILENTVFLWSTRFTFSIYPVLIITIAGSLHENWDPESRNAIILAVFLGVVCLFLVLHVARVIVRLAKARRTYTTNPRPDKYSRPDAVASFNIEFMTTRF